ncbi:MAG TPA: NAD-dependent epimerase/dehydratase family protein [Iamia sp.]|nr:NAD-dependent epimerase/dehydratase family protein [Iamia sp.]
MKVFLAGGTGVVGTRALPALVAAGHEVTAVARGPEKAALVERLGGTPVSVDLFDPPGLATAVAGHEVVVDLATAIPPLARSARKTAWALNDRLRREASRHLVDAALAAGAGRYVQESICFPYLDAGDRWIDEDSPVDHDSWGFGGAGEAERQTARFTADSDGGAGVVLRFAQFYAAGSSHTITMSRALRYRLNPFVGDPDGYVSQIHAADAGSAVAAALTAPAGIYNIVDDEPLVRREAGPAAAAAMGLKPPRTLPGWVWKASPPTAKAVMRSLRISHDRFTAATGWTPTHPSIRTGWPADPTTEGGGAS